MGFFSSEGFFLVSLPVPFLLTGIFVLNWGKRTSSALTSTLKQPLSFALHPSVISFLFSVVYSRREEQVRRPLPHVVGRQVHKLPPPLASQKLLCSLESSLRLAGWETCAPLWYPHPCCPSIWFLHEPVSHMEAIGSWVFKPAN